MILRRVKCIDTRILIPRKTHVRYNTTIVNEARERLKSLGEGKIYVNRDDESGIASITIDNREKKNAISGSMMTQLEAVVNELEAWHEGKGVILKAAGGDIFCSGGDISNYDKGLPSNGFIMSTFMHITITRLFSLPLVTVALVNGKAIGGGAELTTATDFRVFSDTGEVLFVQGKMGVVTGWGGGTRLVRILGPQRALDLLITSRKLGAEEALKIGFADYVIKGEDEESRFQQTKEWLRERLTHHHTVIQAFKRIVVGARDLNLEDSLLNERTIFSPLWGGPVNLEALKKSIKHK